MADFVVVVVSLAILLDNFDVPFSARGTCLFQFGISFSVTSNS